MKPREKSIPTFEARQFAGTIVGESPSKQLKLLASPYYRTFLNQKCKTGDMVTMTLTLKKPKRSVRQNSYYWMYLGMIADETGNDPDDLHELFKKKFLPTKIADVMGEQVEKNKSTTDLSRLDFGDYIAKIEEFTEIQAPPVENFDI